MTSEPARMDVRIEIFQDTAGEHRFTIINSGNNEPVSVSEGYSRRIDCENTAKALHPDASITYLKGERD